MITPAEQRAWHTMTADEVAAAFDVSPAEGLSPGEAAGRLERDGPNEIGA
jgi:hypothetical protein